MDIKDFLRDAKRMCEAQDGTCHNCPVDNTPFDGCIIRVLNSFDIKDEEINAVEEWSKEHPFISNRQKVIEIFGEDSSMILEAMSETWADGEYKNPDKEEDEDGEDIGQFED